MKNKLYIPICSIIAIIIIWVLNIFIVGNFSNYEKYLSKGEKYFKEGNIEQSIKEFKKVSSIKPKNIEARFFLVKSYMALNKKDEAILEYKEILEIENDNSEALKGLISLYEKSGNYDELKNVISTLDTEFIKDNKPQNPEANKSSGFYSTYEDIEFVSEGNSKILFTLDGLDPDYKSRVYTQPIHLRDGIHKIKAVTLKNGFMSNITELNLTIEPKIEIIEFKNKNIEKAVLKNLNKNEGPVTNQQIANIKNIFIYGKDVFICDKMQINFNSRKSLLNSNYIEVAMNDDYPKNYGYNVNRTNINAVNLEDLQKFSNMETLIILGVDNINIDFISQIQSLKHLNITNCHYISKKNLENQYLRLKSLFLIDTEIKDISFISRFLNLEELDFSHNLISDVSPIKTLKNLKKLNLDNNDIYDVTTLFTLSNLKIFSFDSNNVSDLEGIQNLNNLSYLSFSNNKVKNISSIKNLVTLEDLYFANNLVIDKNYAYELPYLKRSLKDDIHKEGY